VDARAVLSDDARSAGIRQIPIHPHVEDEEGLRAPHQPQFSMDEFSCSMIRFREQFNADAHLAMSVFFIGECSAKTC
jgi:hypothetical protein